MKEEKFTLKERIIICVILDALIVGFSAGYFFYTKPSGLTNLALIALALIVISNLLVLIFGGKALDTLVDLFGP